MANFNRVNVNGSDVYVEDASARSMIAVAYDSAKTYGVGSHVIYNDSLYQCNAETTGTFDSKKWTKIVLADEIDSLNKSLANKASASDLTALQNTLANNYYTKTPQNLPSGFNSTDRASMNHLKNGWYWHSSNDGTLNFPDRYGFMIKFGFESDGDFSALYFTQVQGAIYRCSGNAYEIHGWVAI